jgi:phosphocarrier protein
MSVSRKSSGSEPRTASSQVTVINKLGVHARPAAMFVKTANKFSSDIAVEKDGEQVNGKSIMGLMMLAAGQGATLIITAEGSDAETAVRELVALFQRKFDEE